MFSHSLLLDDWFQALALSRSSNCQSIRAGFGQNRKKIQKDFLQAAKTVIELPNLACRPGYP